MSNKIIEGRYKGGTIDLSNGGITVKNSQKKLVSQFPRVKAYDVAEQGRNLKLGAGSAAAATLLLGPVGLAGGLMAARKTRLAIITWDNDEASLVEVRSNLLHRALLKASFSTR